MVSLHENKSAELAKTAVTMQTLCCRGWGLRTIREQWSLFPPTCSDPNDPLVPSGELEENGVKFKFSVYKRELPRER